MVTATTKKAAVAGTMASFGQAPAPARASTPAKKPGPRTVRSVRVEVAENGFTVSKHYEHDDGPYIPEKDYIAASVDEVLEIVQDCFGAKQTTAT